MGDVMTKVIAIPENYDQIRIGIVELLNSARAASARTVNAVMTATYWEIGRRIVNSEQRGGARAEYYGEQLVEQLRQRSHKAIWPWIWQNQSVENARLLPCLVFGEDSFETVERIC
jgi:hypothetical protein